MGLPHSPRRSAELSSMAHSDDSRPGSPSKGSGILRKLVAGHNPFSKSARKHHDHDHDHDTTVDTPPRSTSLASQNYVTRDNSEAISQAASSGSSSNLHHPSAMTTSNVPTTQTTSSNQTRQALDSHMVEKALPREPASSNEAGSQLATLDTQRPELVEKALPQEPTSGSQAVSQLTPLEQQRQELVDRIVDQVRKNKAVPLDEVGRQRFEKAGFGDRVGIKSTVEVDTRWLKPVIQETIIRKEHTEYHTVIDRHVHIHHVYPKIQPIHDPDPIRLQPRHRFFSPRTGHWHEVIGDEEAIALLGEDAFKHGPKEYREIRRAALPGLDPSYYDQPEEIRQVRKARVIEREGVDGAMGSWHALKGDLLRTGEEADDVHLIDGLEGLGEGVRTMHVSI